MFYCNPCAKENDWPETITCSFGPCEVCGNSSICNEMPSKLLPIGLKPDYRREKERVTMASEQENDPDFAKKIMTIKARAMLAERNRASH